MPETLTAEEFARRYGGQSAPPPTTISADEFKARYGGAPSSRPRAKDAVIPETLPDLGGWSAHPMTQAVIGAGKGIIKTGASLYNALPGPSITNEHFLNALEPENTPQKVGQFVETAAEFAAGEGIAAKAATKIAPALAKTPTALRSIAGMAGGAGVTAAHGGEAEEVATNAAIGGVAPWAFKALGKGIKALGQKIQTSVIRPSLQDVRDGFNIATLEKYNLGGSLDASAQKTAAAIQERSTALQSELQAAQTTGVQVDLGQALATAEQELLSAPGKLFGRRGNVQGAIDKLRNEIAAVSPTGQTDIITAQQVKRATGNLGAWQFGSRDPDATAMELVANTLYSKLRQAIEVASGGGRVGALNVELSELIPVENAIIRRIPVAARNNVISLGNFIAIAHGHAPLVAAEFAMKSGNVGNALTAAGRSLGGGMPKMTALAQAGVMESDPFGLDNAVQDASAEVQQQSGGDSAIARQIMGGKRQVYIGPDGTETPVPASIALSFANGDANSPLQKWLGAIQKQGKIKPGGHLAFVNQE